MVFAPCLLGLVLASTPSPPSFCDGDGWEAVWSDEFDGTELNASNWALRETVSGTRGRNVDRMAKVMADDVMIRGGLLIIRTQHRRAVQGNTVYNYTSGAVHTRGLRSWRGPFRACVRAQLPGGPGGIAQGIQPAHWMMPDTDKCWPSNGEIDIMEMFDGSGEVKGTYIWKDFGCNKPYRDQSIATPLGDGWATTLHEYAVEYDGRSRMTFVVDGRVYNVVTNASFFDVPYYFILDTSLGSAGAGPPNASTALPTEHRVDYVRVSVAKR